VLESTFCRKVLYRADEKLMIEKLETILKDWRE